LDAAVILAAVVFELHADPVAGREAGLADIADDGRAAIVEPDELPDCELRHCERRLC
jgi:hypothetical protein